MAINRRSYVPAYLQLAAVLREQIDTGELPAGAPLPSENHLARTYGIGRETVRKALTVLRTEGLVITRRTEGTFVREAKPRRTVAIDASTTVTARMPSPAERAELDLDEGIPVVVIRRQNAQPELLAADEVEITGA